MRSDVRGRARLPRHGSRAHVSGVSVPLGTLLRLKQDEQRALLRFRQLKKSIDNINVNFRS